jgi:hypothetical protein
MERMAMTFDEWCKRLPPGFWDKNVCAAACAAWEAATAAERERCAKVCEGFYQAGPADLPNFVANSMAIKCAAAIRGTP